MKVYNSSETSIKHWYETLNQNLRSCYNRCSSTLTLPYPLSPITDSQQLLALCKIPVSSDAVYESCTQSDLVKKGLLTETNGEVFAYHIVRLTAYIPGEIINVDEMDANLAYNWGKAIATVSLTMKVDIQLHI